MTKKTNLAEAISRMDRPNKITPTQPKARSGMKAVAGYFEQHTSKQLKILAVEQERTIQDLLGEALGDLFKKYGKAAAAAK